MHLFRRLLFILLILTSAVGLAHADVRELKNACLLALGELSKVTGTAETKHEVVDLESRSIEFIGSKPGTHGGRILHVRRILGDDGTLLPWVSIYSEHVYDLQGDPRWFVDSIGPKYARYFGFEKINNAEYWLPDAVEFLGAVNTINRELIANHEKPSRFNYFIADSEADVQVKKYVGHIRSKLETPLAPRGHHLIHNLAFHSGMLFAPERLGDVVQGEADLHQSFFTYLKAKYEGDPQTLDTLSNIEYVSSFIDTVRYDALTGVLGYQLSTLRADNRDAVFSSIAGSLRTFEIGSKLNPEAHAFVGTGFDAGSAFTTPRALGLADRFLSVLISLQHPTADQLFHLRQPKMNEEKFKAVTERSKYTYTTHALISDFHAFLKTYRAPFKLDIHQSASDLILRSDSSLHIDEAATWIDIFCHEVRENKLRIIRIIQKLESTAS